MFDLEFEPRIHVCREERREGKRDTFSEARRGSRKDVSARKSRGTDVGMSLFFKKLSV